MRSRKSLLARLCVASMLLAAVAVTTTDLRAYGLLGYKWGTNQVLYYVNPSNNYSASSAVITAVQNAATAWTAQTSANIQLVYAGTTSGGSFTVNNKNEVFFRSNSTSPAGETYWWSDAGGRIVDADIALNQGRYAFSADGSTCSGAIDVQNITTHELGHALGLTHSGASDATMFPTMSAWCDTSWSSLSADDIAGIQALYPGGAAPSAPAAPTSLTAARNPSNATGSLLLSWTDRSNNESGFKVERSLNGSSFTQVALLGVNSVSYADSGLAANTLYYYRVAAFNSTASSAYTNTGSASTDAAAVTAGPSPDGTLVPTATQIIDGTGAIWTISGLAILRNGAGTGGQGSKILWSGGAIYVFGTDSNWWRWTGSTWINVGPTQPGGTTSTSGTAPPPSTGASPDGSLVPTVSQIVDGQGAVWTISGLSILRNGASTGGQGSKILWSGGAIYVFGTDSNWWQWLGSGWSRIGPTQPGGGTTSTSGTAPPPSTGASPDGSLVPTVSQIVDGQGAVWTISGLSILRNGASTGGQGSKILWSGGVIYVFGTDSNWWRWTGGGWSNVGGTQPASGGASADGTQLPTASQIVDSQGAIWTISGLTILRNGALTGGMGSKILWSGGVIYVFGTDSNWWRWTGSGWVNIGSL